MTLAEFEQPAVTARPSWFRNLAVCYLVVQAGGGLGWWIMLLVAPDSRTWFMATAAPDSTLLAFAMPDLLLFVGASALAGLGLYFRQRWGWPVLCLHCGGTVYAGLYCLKAVVAGQAALAGGRDDDAAVGDCAAADVVPSSDGGTGIMTNVFRPAVEASPAWNIAKTLLQTVVFWSVFLALLPALVFWLESALPWGPWRFESGWQQIAGVVLFAFGGTLGIASGVTMAVKGRGTPLPLDCPREIVVAGSYRYVRNPMAIAGLTQGLAVGLVVGSPAIIAYALAGGPAWNYLVRPSEERDLEQRFGSSFRNYQTAVRCWWPRLRPYHPESRLAAEANPHAPCAEGEQA